MSGPFGLPTGKVHRFSPLRHRKPVGFHAKMGIMAARKETNKPPGTEMPHIEIRDVSLVYDTPAGQVTGVQSESYNVEQSDVLCIVRRPDGGKSTLLTNIAGGQEPTGGVISSGGKAVKG